MALVYPGRFIHRNKLEYLSDLAFALGASKNVGMN
jgi:hypothetical protein